MSFYSLRSIASIFLYIIVACCLIFFSTKIDKQSEKKEIDTNSTGLTISKLDKVSPGFTLIPIFNRPEIKLVNNQGLTIKTWPIAARRVRLSPDCTLLVVHRKAKFREQGQLRDVTNIASEYSWDGKLLREFKVPGEVHHDIGIFNDNKIMILYRYYISRDSDLLNYENILAGYKRYQLKYDAFEVVDYQDGKTVFEWDFLQSYQANACGKYSCPWASKRFVRSDKTHIDWSHVNSITEIPENKWFDMGHKEFKPGNFMITVRNWSAIIILDYETKKIVWEYAGENHGGFEGGHDAYMIPKNLPGAGNILFFDNGDPRLKLNIHTGQSYVLEFDPVSKENVWSFDADKTLLSKAMGSAQRLSNGSTLVSEDTTGRIMEVTANKEIIWQYDAKEHTARAYKYAPDYCKEFSGY